MVKKKKLKRYSLGFIIFAGVNGGFTLKKVNFLLKKEKEKKKEIIIIM